MLDLHKAPGYSFNSLLDNSLFDDLRAQESFLDIWRKLAKRFQAEGDNLIFELLNEAVETDSSRWNALAKKAVEAVREIDKARKQLNIGKAVWTYKGMDFELVDRSGNIINDELVRIVSGKVEKHCQNLRKK